MEFSLCEGVLATSISPWCIRVLKDKRYLGGGIDSGSLCGRVKPRMGWDLAVEVEKAIPGTHICSKCRAEYERLVKTR